MLPVTVILALSVCATVARVLQSRRLKRRIEAEREYRDWRKWVDTMRDEMRRHVTAKQAAALVGRTPSTIHTWVARNKIARVDGGGRGTPALFVAADVYRAEFTQRGRGRPPRAHVA